MAVARARAAATDLAFITIFMKFSSVPDRVPADRCCLLAKPPVSLFSQAMLVQEKIFRLYPVSNITISMEGLER
jgi:hypothetical protein